MIVAALSTVTIGSLVVAILIVILFCCLCEFYARRTHRSSAVPRSERVPRWLRQACGATRRPVQPDDFFDARGEV